MLHVDEELQAEIIAAYNSDLQKAVQVEEKLAREAATQAVKDQVTAVYEEKYADHEEFDRIMRDVAYADKCFMVENIDGKEKAICG